MPHFYPSARDRSWSALSAAAEFFYSGRGREVLARVELLRIRTVGGDKVTTDVVEAWNDRLVFHDDSYGNRISAYIAALKSLSDQLRTSAQQYGFTEEEITATFGPKA